jgi:hypothetical protein
VSGQTSTALGGLRSADIGLVLQYADLNKPQSIKAPTSVRPFSEFQTKLQTLLAAVQTAVGGGAVSSGSSGSSGSTSSSGSGSASTVQSYSQCLQTAGQDVAKMQKCAGLLNK